MTGEYIRGGNLCRFPLADHAAPPQIVTLNVRACSSSPVIELTLSFLRINPTRHAAEYIVIAERPATAAQTASVESLEDPRP